MQTFIPNPSLKKNTFEIAILVMKFDIDSQAKNILINVYFDLLVMYFCFSNVPANIFSIQGRY